MKNLTRGLLAAGTITLGLGLTAARADAHEAVAKATPRCGGYTLTIGSTSGYTGDPRVGVYGDAVAPSTSERSLGGLSTIPQPLTFTRPAGTVSGGVTLYYNDGTKSSAPYSVTVVGPCSTSSQPPIDTTTTVDTTVDTTVGSTAPTTQASLPPTSGSRPTSPTTSVDTTGDTTTTTGPFLTDPQPSILPPPTTARPTTSASVQTGIETATGEQTTTTIRTGRLPSTGADATTTMVLFAGGFLVIGGLLLTARRRAHVDA